MLIISLGATLAGPFRLTLAVSCQTWVISPSSAGLQSGALGPNRSQRFYLTSKSILGTLAGLTTAVGNGSVKAPVSSGASLKTSRLLGCVEPFRGMATSGLCRDLVVPPAIPVEDARLPGLST